jgi:hypothetical protein
MKYTPTPRDLFNPPPQARTFNNTREIEEIESLIEKRYPDYYDERKFILERMLRILKEHDEHVFEGVR